MRRDGQRAGTASPGLQSRGGGSHLQDLPQSGLYSTVALPSYLSAIIETVAEENKQKCHQLIIQLLLLHCSDQIVFKNDIITHFLDNFFAAFQLTAFTDTCW
jgi:hypothetical protein